ncbi:VirB8/TrbF family protein [Bradyrhizobium sp. LMG 9283]|uniref:VirB8/TrbF family protein n=1 Tax=Bradyrhizobium sp. LMG 9283 TaxID=592064 RepID=UPI00388D60E9
MQVAVEVSSVIRASPESFRLSWIERRYDNGQLAATERWSAIMSMVVEGLRDPRSPAQKSLGIYVNVINRSKELG